MNLFKVNGEISIDTSNVYIDGQQVDLSVCKITQSEYDKLVYENNCLSNTLYVVETDYINAYNQQIKNVADPKDAQDVVTLKYAQENFDKTNIEEDKFVLKSELRNLIKDTVIDLLKN